MKLEQSIALGLLFFTTNSFAYCEREKNEYEEWNSRCEDLSSASKAAGAAGGFFAVFTFGASMVPAAVAITAANNACRIRDEKKNNLDMCMQTAGRHAQQEEAVCRGEAERLESKRLAEQELARWSVAYAASRPKRLNDLRGLYQKMLDDAQNQYRHELDSIFIEYADRDLNDPQVIQELDEKRSAIDQNFNFIFQIIRSDSESHLACLY